MKKFSPMDEKDKDLEVSPEEQKAEEEAKKEVNNDELRSKLAEDFELDLEEDSELLGKLVEREKTHHEKLSGAIKQKINWREVAQKNQKTSEKPKDKPEEDNTKPKETPLTDEAIDKKLDARFEDMELNSLNLSDELKSEVKDLAKLKGISIGEAAKHPYILSMKEKEEREARIKAATPKRTSRGSYATSTDPAKPLRHEDFDFTTDEGVKAWREAKAAREKYRREHGE